MKFFRFNGNNCYYLIAMCYLLLCCSTELYCGKRSLYGHVKVDPTIKELIKQFPIKKLNFIDTSGANRYFRKLPSYTFFDYSLGVYTLAKKYKLPLRSQIAGFISPIFKNACNLKDIRQESNVNIVTEYKLEKFNATDIVSILQKHHLTLRDILDKEKNFPPLYSPAPNMSVEILEFTLRLGYLYQIYTKKDVDFILANLFYKDNRWYFSNVKAAQRFAETTLIFTERYWGSATYYVVNTWFHTAVKRGIELNLIKLKDVLMNVDKNILQKLIASQDRTIKTLLMKCSRSNRFFNTTIDAQYDHIFHPPFKGVDPWVKIRDKTFKKLSSLDKKFAKNFNTLKYKMEQGIKIVYR